MWFGTDSIPMWLSQCSVFLHGLFAVCFGFFPEEYVKHHHATWYERVKGD